jgi:hypothetical protein
MFGASGLLSSIDYRNAGEVYKTPADNIVITTVNPVIDSNWELLNVNNKLIKSTTTNVGSSSTNGSASLIITFISNSDHSMDQVDSNEKFVFSPYATPYCYTDDVLGGGDVRARTGGSHTHIFEQQTFSSAANFPSYVRVALYKRKIDSNRIFELPIGTIVFAEDLTDVEGVSATSSYNNKYLCAVNDQNLAGTSYIGKDNFSYNIVSSTAGAHSHPSNRSGPNQTGQIGIYLAQTGARADDQRYTSHTHQGTIDISVIRKNVSLRTYKVSMTGVYITRGMIFGFSSSNIPPNWYICDGSIINGYQTPRINDRYPLCGNELLSSHDNILNNDNHIATSASLDTATWNHYHGTADNYQAYSSITGKYYHGPSGNLTAHNHRGSGKTTYFEHDRFNLIYCIYLP